MEMKKWEIVESEVKKIMEDFIKLSVEFKVLQRDGSLRDGVLFFCDGLVQVSYIVLFLIILFWLVNLRCGDVGGDY